MAKHKLFLLDAMALLYRSHFAFIRNPRITSEGLNTSAVFGFTNTVLEILNKEDPTHMAVVFDAKGPTFRHESFPAYKANREAPPEDLIKAIGITKRLLKILNIAEMELTRYEADDIIGTISQKVDTDCDVFMVTPDKDYAQLVKENVYLYRPQRGGGFEVLDVAGIEEKFSLHPSKIIDFLGLKGDAVDNIPGIPKVGDKTAVALINEFGSMEEIVARAEEITKKSIRESVMANKEQGLESKELATIHTEVPIEWSMEQMELGHADLEELQVIMKELEFKTTAQRVLNSKLNPMRVDQKDLFGNIIGADGESFVDDQEKNIENTPHTYALIREPAERAALIKILEQQKEICFDTETTGLDPLQAEMVGMSFSFQSGTGWFVHFPNDLTFDEVKEIAQEFAPIFQNPNIVKIGQNLKYDILMLSRYDIEVVGPFFDTMIAHFVVSPGSKHGMDAMASELLNYKTVSIETLIGKKGKKQLSMREADVDKLIEYASEDADITLQLKEKLAPEVKDNKIFHEIDQPLLPVLTAMEIEGIRLNTEFLADYSVELEGRLGTLEKEIYNLAGEEFNINSPRQLGEIMFDKLGLGKGPKQKKTKTGQYVTNEQVLTGLAYTHELPERILAYRGVKKLKSTYVDSLPLMVNPNTGRIHSSFNQTVAVTGRLSSDKPNLQNIPIKTDDGRQVRKGFIPRNDDFILLAADYSQVELRIMAAMSQDEAMLTAFREKQDIHRATAARVFGLTPDEISAQQRSYAKQVNFGIIYGISAFGLSQRIGISRTEAKDIIETYFQQYNRIKGYMDECVEDARVKGYVETYFGRRRYLRDINSQNATVRGFAERNAINSPIQGTAADIIKIAMINLHKVMKEANLKSRMLLQVHDELVFDVYKPELEQMKEIIYKEMTTAVDMGVPMEVEMGTGENWLEAH